MTHTIGRYHEIRGILIDQLGGKCVDCGITDNLEFHTIDGTGENGKGGWQKLVQVLSDINKNNIELKCKTCHIKYHQAHGGKYYGTNDH